MAKLTLDDLRQVSFTSLAEAVADWQDMVGRLDKLADSAKDEMAATSDKARWAGENAGVTKPFVRKTAKEFRDAHAEARSVWEVLDDGHRELTKIQADLKKAVDVDAATLGVKVEDNRDGTVRCFFPHVRGDSDARTQQQLDDAQALATRVARLIAHADEIDDSVARALRKSHGNDSHDFGHSTYTSLDDAQQERSLELARLGPKMTDSQLAELNTHLKFNARDPEFTTAFFTGLGGPEEALKFYGLMSLDGTEGTDKERLALTKELQRGLGTSLATATDPDNKTHLPASWGAEFRKLGTQPVRLYPGSMNDPYGYQILGGMLRYGNYDARFINPIAEHITQLHHDDPDKFMLNKPVGIADLDYGFNPSGRTGAGYDPLTSVLEALGHSPEASLKFFSEETTPTVYREDGTVDKNAILDYRYLDDFLKKDFKWPPDTLAMPSGDIKDAFNHGPDALGHALESATTGRPYDSGATADAVRHSPEAARLTERLVSAFGDSPGLLQHNENGDLDSVDSGPLYAMRDSLGNITAEYMGDFQRAMYEGQSDADLPSFGEPANLDSNQTERFLSAVGQDPDAYASITSAQQAYSSQRVDDVINGQSNSSASIDGRVRDAVAPGATMAGIMSQARGQAVLDYHSASDAEFNAAAEENAAWVNRIVGMGIGSVAERVPLGGEVLGWLQEDITASVLESIAQDSTEEAQGESSRSYTEGRVSIIHASEAAVTRAAMNNPDIHPDTVADLKRSARTQAGDSHSAGAQWNSAGHS
ncbi:hypothetical protein ACFY7Z_04310 [Streptomyces sp. NPDC012623]|uniref:hypothetical protein n=1 Tax=unclassified Streptomyces TaxID=2593676 RepID=UPI0036B22206